MSQEDNLKPLWVESFLNNDELLEIFNKGMKLREEMLSGLEYAIKLEKQNPILKKGELPKFAIMTLLGNEIILKRLLQKFRQDHYITTGLIDKYWEKIDATRDRVREITIRENLGDRNHD